MTYSKFINPKLITISALTSSLLFTPTIANANETYDHNPEMTDKSTSSTSESIINVSQWSISRATNNSISTANDSNFTETSSVITDASQNNESRDINEHNQENSTNRNTDNNQTNRPNISTINQSQKQTYTITPRAPRRTPHRITNYHQHWNFNHIKSTKQVITNKPMNNHRRMINAHDRFNSVIDNKIQWLVNQRKNRKLGNQQMITLLSEKTNRSGLTTTISNYY